MDQRQHPQYPQQPPQPGGGYPPEAQLGGGYPPYAGQGSGAPYPPFAGQGYGGAPYSGPVYGQRFGQGYGPVPPQPPQYVYHTPDTLPGGPGARPPRRRKNRAPLVAVLLCLGLAATVFLAGEAFRALRSGGAASAPGAR